MVRTEPTLEAAWQLLFSASDDAVAVVSRSVIVYANNAYRTLYAHPPHHDCRGQPFLNTIAPAARVMALELLREGETRANATPSFRMRGLRADDTEFVTEVHRTRSVHDGVVHLVTVHTQIDASPRRPQHDDAFFRSVFNNNTAIKLLIDPDNGAIVDANRTAADFYGWTLDELRQMTISDINQLSPDEVHRELQSAKQGQRGYFRFRHRLKNGDRRDVEVHSGPVEIGDRQLLFSIIFDVTERNALARQLRASQQLEAVGRLAGGIAHEFNNLLTVILNGSSVLLRRMEAASPLRRYLEDMSFASERAADLTRDLLAFSRRQVMAPQTLDLNDVVERMSGLLQRSLGSAITVTTKLARDLPPTRSDARQLEHVLMNLVLNARDALPRGGEIQVITDVVQVGKADTTIIPTGDWVSLKVIDEGEGMDEETKARLFEPFFTTKAGASGTGLGLATVYGIVTQSGGHIRVESELGRGTQLEVLLPVADVTTTTRPPLRSSSAPSSTATVLLVDDIDAVRRSLARSLEGLGFNVLEAVSYDEAMTLWDAHRGSIEAVVTDIVMTGRSGVELAVKLTNQRPTLAVLVISGDLRGHDLGRLPTGARKLQKPVTAQIIADELTSMLSRRR